MKLQLLLLWHYNLQYSSLKNTKIYNVEILIKQSQHFKNMDTFIMFIAWTLQIFKKYMFYFSIPIDRFTLWLRICLLTQMIWMMLKFNTLNPCILKKIDRQKERIILWHFFQNMLHCIPKGDWGSQKWWYSVLTDVIGEIPRNTLLFYRIKKYALSTKWQGSKDGRVLRSYRDFLYKN